MSKPPTIKCRQCGKSTPKQDAIEYKPKFYFCCEQCKQDYINAHAVKSKQESKDDRRKLLDYIRQVAPDANMRLVGIQLAQLMKDNPDMTYGGIAYTIRYIHKELGKDVSKSPLGLVKYKYDECKKYYTWLNQVRQNIQQWQAEDGVEVIVKKNDEEDVFG